MKDGETEDSGMHLRGVYGSQTDFDVDESQEEDEDEREDNDA